VKLDAFEGKGIETCLTCPSLCRWACPVAEAESRETVSPHRLVTLGGFLRSGTAPVESAADMPYRCSHCGACTEACLHKNDVPLLLSLARHRLVEGHTAPQSVNEVRGRFGVAANPQGAALDGVLAQITTAADVDLARQGGVVYFPGCETLSSLPDAATSFLRATLLYGITGVVVTPISAACCGLPLLWAGDLDGFALHAERFAGQVKDVEALLVHDPACADAMKRRYPSFGVELVPRIVHVAEFLADKLGATPAAHEGSPRGSIAYADTCNLARALDLVDAPRKILEKIVGKSPIELGGQKGRQVDCCGAGGLLPLTAPLTARAMGEARIQAFRESKSDELAMFSPRCEAHLRTIEPDLKVVDVTMVLSRL
jgi:Fe-S oxidoreductase